MKVGESVIINKPNHKADGLGGIIVSINETKRIKVNLDCGLEWSFNYSEVEPIGGLIKPIEAIKPKEACIVSSENKKSLKEAKIKPTVNFDFKVSEAKTDKIANIIKPKRAYNKKDKSIEVKPKRKYTARKPKTI